MSKKLLYDKLRSVRRALADEKGCPSYFIFPNSTLDQLIEKLPTNLEELSAIKSFGKKRTEKYGNLILEAIKSFETGIPAVPKPQTATTSQMEPGVVSVSEYLDTINLSLSTKKAIVRGDVTQVNDRGSYLFLTLKDKDDEALLNCIVWKTTLNSVSPFLKEGVEIQVLGYPEVFKRTGSFTFRIQSITLVGEGVLKQAFEVLKSKLTSEGLFSVGRKKPITPYVTNIGLITSRFADAKNDFETRLGKCGFKTYFIDTRVEGVYAVEEIVGAIRQFNESRLPIDVLVLTRGGGSLESLQAFNSEAVARAIYASRIPVICGVGHENDVTIADLVADVRASTPTHAAIIISEPWYEASVSLRSAQGAIPRLAKTSFSRYNERLLDLKKSVLNIADQIIYHQKSQFGQKSQLLSANFKDVTNKMKQIRSLFLNNQEILRNQLRNNIINVKNSYSTLAGNSKSLLKEGNTLVLNSEQKLKINDPLGRLKSGYSIVTNTSGKIVKNSQDVTLGENIKVKLHQGGAVAKVEEVF